MFFPAGIFKRVDPVLLLLVFFVVAINLPYLDSEFMVGHDTKNVYLTFHYFFSHLLSHGEVPRWLPFGEYGYSALFYQISNLSPFSYLFGLIGWIIGVMDTLLLFKLSVLAEQFAFLLGLYLFGQRIYRNRLTVFLVALMGAGSVIWYWQIYWDFRLYYLLPLTLYFYHRFIEEKLYWAFFAGTLFLMFSLIGGLAYWAPVYAYLFLIMALVIISVSWRCLRSWPRPGLRDLPLFLIVIISITALGYVLSTCLSGLHNYSPGRSLDGMRTGLSTFLSYTPPENWWMLHAFLDGTRPNTLAYSNMDNPLSILPDGAIPDDLTLYTGLLPIVGLVIGVFRVRSRWFYCLFAGLVAIFALAGTGLFSLLMYWIMPGMNMFRHMSLLLEIGKVLLLLSGGFGIDLLVERLLCPGWVKRKMRGFSLFVPIMALLFILDMVVSITVHKPDSWVSPYELARIIPSGGWWIVGRITGYLILPFCFYALSRTRKLQRHTYSMVASLLIILVAALDIGALQGYYWSNRAQGDYAGSLEIVPLNFANTRSSIPSEAAVKADMVIRSSPFGAYLAYYSNVLQWDPCMPNGRVDIFPRGVHELVSARGAAPSQQTIATSLFPPDDVQLKTVMACNAPKIRLVPGAAFARSDWELRELVRENPALDQIAVLRGDPQQSTLPAWEDPQPMEYTVRAFDANHLDLEVDVKPGRPGWLVYSDSFDPFWKAYINGREMPVVEAYMAFKAIYLEEGRQFVSFKFDNSLQQIAISWLMFVSITLAFLTFSGLGWQVVKVTRPTQRLDDALRNELDKDESQ